MKKIITLFIFSWLLCTCFTNYMQAQITDTIRICKGETVTLEGAVNLICCPSGQGPCGPADQPNARWEDPTSVLCTNCFRVEVSPIVTTLYRHITPSFTCPPAPPVGGGPAPPAGPSYPPDLKEVLVIVDQNCATPCSSNRGTFFFEDCDDGTPFIFIRLADGRVMDPYFAEGVDFVVSDNQRVKFDFVPAEFASPCSIAEQAIILTCVEAENIPGTTTDNCICDICEVENPLDLPWLQTLLDNFLFIGMNVFWDPTSERMLLSPIPIAADVGFTFYDCTGNVVCEIAGLGGSLENNCPGGLVHLGEFRKPDGTILCGDDGNTYDSYCAAECAGATVIAEGACATMTIFDSYPWLNELVDRDNCSGTTIHEYDLGPYSFIFVNENDAAKLYYEDGTLFCTNQPNYDCLSLYNLSGLTPANEYLCMETNGGGEMEDAFDTYPWLESVLNFEDCCANAQVIDYQSGIFHFLYVASGDCGDGFGTLYFEDGTFYCQESANYDCRMAYGLTGGQVIWTCENGSIAVGAQPIDNFRLTEPKPKLNLIQAFPNPTRNVVNIRTPESKEKAFISVYNLYGSLLYQQPLGEDNRLIQLELAEYESGIYLVEWRTSSERLTTKVIKD